MYVVIRYGSIAAMALELVYNVGLNVDWLTASNEYVPTMPEALCDR